MELSPLHKRLDKAIRSSGLSRNRVAQLVEVGSGTISEWFTKGSVPSGDILSRFTEKLGINGHWLLTGEGTMKGSAPDGESEPPDEGDGAEPSVDDQQIFTEVRDILRDGSMQPGMKVLLIDAANSAWLSAALYRGEVGAETRARAVLRAEETGRVRTEVIQQVEASARERRREIQNTPSHRFLSGLSEDDAAAVEEFLRGRNGGRGVPPEDPEGESERPPT